MYKIEIYMVRKTTFEEKNWNKKFLLFDLKDYILKHICKMYILMYIQGNCKKSNSYKKKNDFWKNLKLFFYSKDFIFCKYICKMYKMFNIRFSKKVWLSYLPTYRQTKTENPKIYCELVIALKPIILSRVLWMKAS